MRGRKNADISNGIYQDDLTYMPFRLFARAFLPNFVRILARKPDFRAFLILLLRAFSIVYPSLKKGHSGPTVPWGFIPSAFCFLPSYGLRFCE